LKPLNSSFLTPKPKLLKCAFHVHTDWTDGKLTPLETVDLYGQAGFDVLAITDHVWPKEDPILFNPVMRRIGGVLNRMVSSLAFDIYINEIKTLAKYAERQYAMQLIPGLEITKKGWLKPENEAHIVALDVREHITADQNPFQVLKAIKAQGAISLAVHPFKKNWAWQNRKAISKTVDVWEYKNGGNGGVKYFPYIKEAGLRHVACDDFHRPKHLGRAVTYLACNKDLKEIKYILSNGINLKEVKSHAIIHEEDPNRILSLIERSPALQEIKI